MLCSSPLTSLGSFALIRQPMLKEISKFKPAVLNPPPKKTDFVSHSARWLPSQRAECETKSINQKNIFTFYYIIVHWPSG